jgi:hypothetical protein
VVEIHGGAQTRTCCTGRLKPVELLATPLRNGPRPMAHVPSQLSAGKRPASRNTCTTVPTENTYTAAVALSLATSHISNPVILLISCLNESEESLNNCWWNSCN